jgi:hypothetical protein
MAREREFRSAASASQCGGFRAKPVGIGLLCTLTRRQRMLDANGLAEREGFERHVRLAPRCRSGARKSGHIDKANHAHQLLPRSMPKGMQSMCGGEFAKYF